MEKVMEVIQGYQKAFGICLGLAMVCLTVSIVLFFVLDIPAARRSRRSRESGKRAGTLLLAAVLALNGVWSMQVSAGESGEAAMEDEADTGGICFSKEHIELNQTPNEHGWIREDVTFFVKDLWSEGEDQSGIRTVEWRKQGQEEDWTPMEWEEALQGWSYTERDDVYVGSYEFRAWDEGGNVSDAVVTQEIRKDWVLPETEGMRVLYRADEELSHEQEDFWAGLGRLFGKQKMEVTLLVADAISGVEEVECIYDGERYTARAPKDAAAWEEGSGYTVIPVTVSLKTGEDGLSADRLKILRVRDRAGNEIRSEEPEAALMEGGRVVILDSVNPILSIECETPVQRALGTDGKQRMFYKRGKQQEEEITLLFEEDYYSRQGNGEQEETMEMIRPALEIEKNTCVQEPDGVSVAWEEHLEKEIAARMLLPYEAGQETEYRIYTSYKDASGNPLRKAAKTWGRMVDEEAGIFQSDLFVLDDKPPVLQDFEIIGIAEQAWNGTNIYQNVEGHDVRISFSIEDHALYWNKEAVSVSVRRTTDGEIVKRIPSEEILWTEDATYSDIHRGECGLDGWEGEEDSYQVVIGYEDRAGNGLVSELDPELSGSMREGVFESRVFILDHKAPDFEISYNQPVRLVDGNKRDYEAEEQTPIQGDAAYYNRKIEAVITVHDRYGIVEELGGIPRIAGFVLEENQCDVTERIHWDRNPEKGIYRGYYSMEEDGNYILSASYRDAAGNPAGEDGYTSPLLIKDTVAPRISFSYKDNVAPVNTDAETGRVYFDTAVIWRIAVEDENARMQELKDALLEMTATDSQGRPLKGLGFYKTTAEEFVEGLAPGTAGTTGITVEIPLTTEANYTIPVYFEDMAGNPAVLAEDPHAELGYYEERVTVDTTPAFVEWSGRTAQGTVTEIPYKSYAFWFAKDRMFITLSARDDVAGIYSYRFDVIDRDGSVVSQYETGNPQADGSCEVVIPLQEKEDFKGSIRGFVTDWSGNKAELVQGSVVESTKKHRETKKLVIETLTEPGRVVDETAYYRGDIRLKLHVEDRYSGIQSYAYKAGSIASGSLDFVEEAKKQHETGSRVDITYETEEEILLSAEANNENGVLVWAEYMDHAGHTEYVEQRYNIDITPPEIRVTYDLTEPVNGRYYKEPRTAFVSIRERNFASGDVEFHITNTEGHMPEIGAWSTVGSGQEALHTCQVRFSEDGEYTFGLSFRDLAGNFAEYETTDVFTIDQTAPKLTIAYDNHSAENDFYYRKQRMALIDVEEHNFDESLVEILVTEESGTGQIPKIGGWVSRGDHHTVRILFEADGSYTLDVKGADLAEHDLPEYEGDFFVIDQTPPVLEITGVKNCSANNGQVSPVVTGYDRNYDAAGTKVKLSGAGRGEQKVDGELKQNVYGLELRLNDFAYTPETDDLYRLEAQVCDLAGNVSARTMDFSINRFGSVYTFDEATEALAGADGRYYTGQEQDLVITETNVDTLKWKEIIVSRNGNVRTLTEGTDFTVKMKQTAGGWKQYTYHLDKKNFHEEGIYIVTICSEDLAENTSDNSSKGKKLTFAVDRSAPSILVSGIEDGARYRENGREITLDIQDNLWLQSMKILVNGKEMETERGWTKNGQLRDGVLICALPAANDWQSMEIIAQDGAGNEARTEEIRFLITPSLFWQFWRNRQLAAGSIACVIVVSAGVILTAVLVRRERRGDA